MIRFLFRFLSQWLGTALFSAALLPLAALAGPLKCVQNGQVFYANNLCPPGYELAGSVERPALHAGTEELRQAQQRAAIEKQRLPKEESALTEKATGKKANSKKAAKTKSDTEPEQHKKSSSKKNKDPKVFKAKAPAH